MWCIDINYIRMKIRVELSNYSDKFVPEKQNYWKRVNEVP